MNQQHADNGGFRTSPHPGQSQPVITQIALQFTGINKDVDTELAVVAGKRYRFTAMITGGFYLGLADVTTAAAVRWICPLYQSVEVQIPRGVTSLHVACDTNNAIGYLVELLVQDEDEYQV